MYIEGWKIIAIAAISLILVCVFFLGIKPHEFLFLHDELLVINYYDALNGLYIRAFQDLNVDNTITLTVTLLDRLYYFLGFIFKLDLQTLQKFFYFIKLFVSILIPYIGFKKFARILNKKEANNVNDYIVWLITFLYAFNTYTTIYWHANAFQLSLILCYAFAPLALYYFKLIIENPTPKLTLLIKEALIFLLMGFSVYFFATFAIVLFIYYVSNLIINPKIIKSSLINLGKLVLLSAPLFSVFLPMVLVIIYGSDTVNATGGETFANLSGGLLYPLFFWFTWGIYNDWFPKNVFTFNDYYRSLLYLISPLAIYVMIFWGIGKRIKDRNIIHFLLILIITLLLVKGSQPPFQELYLELINHFPPFRVFRSPDNKFGFGIILSLCFLLLYTSQNIKKGVFMIVMVLVILIQGYPLFSGTAIKGQNTNVSSDRVIHIPDTYLQVAQYLNQEKDHSGYILPIPPANFSHFIITPTEKHLGQDLIPKLVQNPFVTPDEYSGMALTTYKKMSNSIVNNLEGISDFPIDYFLIRKDLEFVTESTDLNFDNNEQIVSVFDNDRVELFKNDNAANIVEAENAENISYKVISPVEYRVYVQGISDTTSVILNNSFNSKWNIYLTNEDQYNNNTIFNFYPNARSRLINVDNTLHKEFANKWNINHQSLITNSEKFYTTNSDGTVNAYFTLYFQPQTNFYILASITVIFAFIYATFVLLKHDK